VAYLLGRTSKPLPRSHVPRKVELDIRLADYDNGFAAQLAGASFDFGQPLGWRRGWLQADTEEIGQMGGTS
jgi:hypothetical protein